MPWSCVLISRTKKKCVPLSTTEAEYVAAGCGKAIAFHSPGVEIDVTVLEARDAVRSGVQG